MTRLSQAWGAALPAGLAVVASAVASAAAPQAAQAQTTGTVRGTVLDSASRRPITNAQVLVAGRVRAQTDADGRFIVRGLPAGATALRVQRIGFRPGTARVALTAGGTADVQVVLAAQATVLTEVVAVGYGTTSRAEVTGAVAQVTGETVRTPAVASLDAALQGRAPGVQVIQNAGNPGNGITIRVRGPSSISASNQPLYVVDGVPLIQENQSQIGFGGQSLTAVTGLNPDEIDRIDVLKDASAAAIYGSRASNGVILITTRRGRANAPRINLNAYYGGQTIARRLALLNARQYVAFINQANTNDGDPAPFTPGVDDTVNTDWLGAVLRRAPVSNVNLTAQGAGDRYAYLISGSRFGQDGIVIGSGYNRGAGRVNVDVTATPKLSFRSSLNLTREFFQRTENDNTIYGTLANAQALQPNVPLYIPGTRDFSTFDQGLAYVNAAALGTYNRAPSTTLRALGSVEASYTPVSAVRVTGRLGSDIYQLNERRWDSPRVSGTNAAGVNGIGTQANNTATKYLGELFGDVTALQTDQQRLTVTAGGSAEYNRRQTLYSEGQGFGNEQFQYVGTAGRVTAYDGGAIQANLLSGFTRANYSLRNRYQLSGSFRVDGSSRFGPGRRVGIFPAVSAGWTATDERWLAGLRRVGTAKLRASYGVTGNQNIPTFFGFQSAFTRANYAALPGIAPTSLGNPALRWESTREGNVGADFGFVGGRVTLTTDYYSRVTSDLLVQRPVASTSGFINIWDNVGSVKNAGVELQLTTTNFQAARPGGFNWTTDFNVAQNANRVVSLYRGQPFLSGGLGVSYVQVGQPLGAFYALKFRGVNPQNGNAIYENAAGDTTSSPVSTDRKIVGNPNPRYFGGLRNTLAWRALDLTAFLQFSQGQQVFNLFRQFSDDGGLNADNKLTTVLRSWQKPGDITDVPRASASNLSNAYRISSRYVENGSYVRLQEVTLGVRLPNALLRGGGLRDPRLFVTGTNLKLWTKYLGYDPDVNSNGSDANTALGVDFYSYPRARTVSFGLSSGF